MKPFRTLSTRDQLAEHLRQEILRGALIGSMPGIKQLVRGLGVNSTTVAETLKQLEVEGILSSQGPRRCYRIALTDKSAPPAMRIAYLNYDPASESEAMDLELLRELSEQGHNAFFTGKTLVELNMAPRRVARLVERTEADAWIVASAPREVLKWFVGSGLRTFALFGSWRGLPLAAISPDHSPILLKMTRRLIEYGHRRIVFLHNRGRLETGVNPHERLLLGEMERHGIPTGPYNLPRWEDSPEGFRRLLDSMFTHSPPTALVIEEIPHFVATLQFCGQRGIRVPEDLSLACTENRFDLAYCTPPVTHTRWNHAPIVRRIVRWANAMARGREDIQQGFSKAEFVEGGTIGPVPGVGNRS